VSKDVVQPCGTLIKSGR